MTTLIHQAIRFAADQLRNAIPHHECYRPVGVHDSSSTMAHHPGCEARYHQVYDGGTVRLVVPHDFPLQTPRYYHPIAAEEKVAPAFVLALPGGRINVDHPHALAVIAADNWLVGDASVQFEPAHAGAWAMAPAAHNPIFQQRYFQAPAEIAGTVCSLLAGGGAESGNYYHWLVDSLPRLHLIQEAGLWDSVDYFLIYDREHRVAMETLLALGIRNEQILDVQTHRHLRAQHLLVTSPVRGRGNYAPAWAGTFLKAAFGELAAAAATTCHFSPLVYVSRRDATHRHVRNEPAVEALLAEYGFESYALSELSFREKVALFSGARAVVGPVGTGLANVLFCRPGTLLIELSNAGFVVPEYLDLASRLGMPYHSLVSDADKQFKGASQGAFRLDISVDLPALRRVLQQALAHPIVEAAKSPTDELLLPA